MVEKNLESCMQVIKAQAEASGRTGADVTLVAVTKGVGLPLIYRAIEGGVEHIGENRIQEALLKFGPIEEYAKSKGRRLVWHMVGHLQTNKVREAVRLFDLIDSVDSVRLAKEIDRCAARVPKIQDIFLEVKTSFESTKYGFKPGEVLPAIREMAVLKNIKIKGLMTIAPLEDEVENARPYFKLLRELRERINESGVLNYNLMDLSMGMSDDFKIAVEEGATFVRLGRAIFGERAL